jgi:hypothetical protein
MRLLAFVNDQNQPALGVRIDSESLLDLTAAGASSTLDEVLRDGDAGVQKLEALRAKATRRVPLEGLNYLPRCCSPTRPLRSG